MDTTRTTTWISCKSRMLAACLVAAVAAFASTASAQTFKSDEPKITNSEGNALYLNIVKPVLENAAEFQKPESRPQLEQYFKDFLFPVMTRSTAAGLRELGRNREKLLRSLQPPVHERHFSS